MDEVILRGTIFRIADDERRDGYVKLGIDLESGYKAQIVVPQADAPMFGYGDAISITISVLEE